MKSKRPILIAEDDESVILMMQRSIAPLELSNPIKYVTNGEDAIRYLEDGGRPFLILLDINMPRMNGLEFLEERKNRPEWQNFPVVILSTSDADIDKSKAYELGVCGYMIKPIIMEDFQKVIKTVLDYWRLSEVVE
ncbi:MAG: response regulator [Cyclobacteriaceae bacterium]